MPSIYSGIKVSLMASGRFAQRTKRDRIAKIVASRLPGVDVDFYASPHMDDKIRVFGVHVPSSKPGASENVTAMLLAGQVERLLPGIERTLSPKRRSRKKRAY